MKNVKWNIGERTFYIEKWSDSVHEGTIRDIQHTKDGTEYAVIHDLTLKNDITVRTADLHMSTRNAIKFQQHRNQELYDQYSSEIHSIAELLKFGYTHNISKSEEYTDWTAREVYYDMAKSMLGTHFNIPKD